MRKSSSAALPLFVVGTLLILVLTGLLAWRQIQPGPSIELVSPPSRLGTKSPLTLRSKAQRGELRWVGMRLEQGELSWSRRHELMGDGPDSLLWDSRLDLEDHGFVEGTAELLLLAGDSWRRPFGAGDGVQRRIRVELDFTPPALAVLASTRYAREGGSAMAIVGSEEASRVFVEVAGQRIAATAALDGEGRWAALYALPLRSAQELAQAIAIDEAGNERARALPVIIRSREIAHSTVRLPRKFLEERLPLLLPELAPISPDSLGAAFQVLSQNRRAAAARQKREFSADSSALPRWKGALRQPPGTQVSSNFAQRRDYLLDGVALDTQHHMGYDLASTRNAAVPATADGRVVYTGDLGIYGNVVVLDHGLGLQSLYAHLSRIDVVEGQELPTGFTLGRSGTTGLAVGDHVHLEILIGGHPVDAREWWDRSWVENNIHAVMMDGGLGSWLP